MTNQASKIFRALAHGKRQQILLWLKNPRAHFPKQVDGDLIRDGVCVLRIAEKLAIKQPTATQHLQVLADAGLVIASRIGKWTFYRRNEEMIASLKSRIFDEI